MGLLSPAFLPRRAGEGEAGRRLGGDGERRVKEEKRLLVGDDEGRERERDFRTEMSTGFWWYGGGMRLFRGDLGGGVGGSLSCLGEPGLDSLGIGAAGGSVKGFGSTGSVSFGGMEMTPSAPSCSEDV